MTPTFHYKAQASDNSIYEDEMTAESKTALKEKLENRGEQLIRAGEAASSGSIWKRLIQKMKMITTVGTREKISFARNLGLMLEAGLSLSRALSVLRRQASNARFKHVVKQIEDDISGGSQLYEALSAHDDIFSELFISMVKSGEESGNLADSLKSIADQIEQAHDITKKVRGAMIYPAVIVVIMIAIAILSMVFIVPTLQKTFEGLGTELPVATRTLIAISEFMRDYWIVNIIGAFVAIGGIIWYFRTRQGSRVLDWIFLHTPFIKDIVVKVNAGRTARTLASLLSSGVDYVVALDITRDVVQNTFYKEVLAEASDRVERGDPLSDVITEHEKLYPVFVGEMASVGEETGQIAAMFANTASYYESEVTQKTKNMSTIVEPLLMVLMGIGVGLFAISMLQPMYSLVGNI